VSATNCPGGTCASPAPASRADAGLSPGLTLLLAAACGLVVANLYYAQPLAGPISAALGMEAGAAGLIVTLTQVGYGLGLLFIVPLGDLVENRRLVLVLVGLCALALAGAAFAATPAQFLAAALTIGISSVAVQVLVPYAAHLASEAQRGAAVGNVMSGLLLGIMLARPVASLVAQLSSWPMIFRASALLMIAVAAVLARLLPARTPVATLRYGPLLASMGRLVASLPALRRRSLYHACMFGAFSLFWTTTPLLLASPAFGLSQGGIALFALAGVAGAVAAPIAGRVADRGRIRPATAVAMGCAIVAFAMTRFVPLGSPFSLALLVAAAILLDFGVAGHMTLGQRVIFGLDAHVRSRLNAVYMTTFFMGGALGSALGGWAWARGGWPLASMIGMGLPMLAAVYFATE
jgi:predicted MFS family arabinose efflux permease